MREKVAAYIEKHHMIQRGDHICVGLSGGADSVSLFLLLESLRHQMGFTMSAVHVEHGIRGEESLLDMEFARQLAESYGVSFAVYQYPVKTIAAEQGISVEEAGRNVRYQAFEKETVKYAAELHKKEEQVKVALAHHGDDNAETILFHLCRGSGIDGLVGIPPVRGNVIRPLLGVTRKEIEQYLQTERQVFRTDATNADVTYSRNRIRNRIMPELMKINDRTVMHMNALAEDAAEISAYFREKVDEIVRESRMPHNHLQHTEFAVKGLEQYPEVLQRRVMLEVLAEVAGSRKDITREHTKALLDIAKGQVGRKISLSYGIVAEKTYDSLLFYRNDQNRDWNRNKSQEESLYHDISEYLPIDFLKSDLREACMRERRTFAFGTIEYQIFENEEKYLKVPQKKYTKWFDYDKIKNRLCLRRREPGDYFIVDAAGHRQKLKDYWINEKVPKMKREDVLLLADGSHILWAIGYRISEYYKVTESTKWILEVQFMEEKYE